MKCSLFLPVFMAAVLEPICSTQTQNCMQKFQPIYNKRLLPLALELGPTLTRAKDYMSVTVAVPWKCHLWHNWTIQKILRNRKSQRNQAVNDSFGCILRTPRPVYSSSPWRTLCDQNTDWQANLANPIESPMPEVRGCYHSEDYKI